MKGGSGRRSFEIKDFSGGLITKSPPKNINSKYSIDCLNVYNEGLTLRERDGIAVVNGTATVGTGNGVYNWIRGNVATNQWLVNYWGSTLTKMDITAGVWDGVWDTLIAHSASGTSFTAGTMHFANYNSVLLLATENYDRVQRMTTSESSYFNIETGGTGTAPRCKFLNVWKNHAWFINAQNSDDLVVHSAVNSYNNFTGSTYGSNNLITENDIGCTGSFVLSGKLYVTKAFSIHRFTYTGSPSPLVDIKIVESEIGTKSPRAIKNVTTPEGKAVLMLGSNKKLYFFDGQDMQEISDAIDITNGLTSVYMQAINANALEKCFAVIHTDLNWYELFICVGTTTSPTHSIVYDYRTKSFWPMDNRLFSAGNVSDDGAGRRRVYVQGVSNGKAYLTNSTNSDDGSTINSYWISERLGSETILQKFDEIEVETDAVVTTPTFSWRADWESTFISQTMKSNTNSHNWNPGRVDNMIQFRILNNSTTNSFKLWSIIGSERPVGGGK